MSRRRVVVTGMGVASPLGCDVDSFWRRLVRGDSGVVALDGPEFASFPTPIGARVQGYVAADHFDVKEARRTSRTSQLAVVAATQAVKQARLLDGGVDRQETAVLVGSAIGGFSASDHFYRDFYLKGRAGPLIIPTSMNSGPSANVSIRLGLGGPLFNVDGACASGTHSVGQAFQMIRSGVLDVALAGGADSSFTLGVMTAWSALRVLSKLIDEPARACRPFSADRDGIVLGEGAGVLVLESEQSARARGQEILAEVVGYGASADSHSLTQPSPDGPTRALRKALSDASLRPEQVGYVNAHGTGTDWNDRTETTVIKNVFGDRARSTLVVGNKGALGHGISAGGALELVGCILTLRDRVVPPTINHTVPDPECDLDYVTTGARGYEGDFAVSNSFAFGGSNAVLAVGRYRP
jgi:3-oxoacyl-(acyl-carrier-protein) synthase